MRFFSVFLVVSSLLCGLSGCGKPGADESGETKIVTTTGMITDIVKVVAGEHAEVESLIGQGVDPHLYKPTRNDVKSLETADVVFYNGLTLEGRMEDVFEDLSKRGKHIYPVTASLESGYLRTPDDSGEHPDPHVWMDITAWRKCTEEVADRLSEVMPEHADEFRANAKAYVAELDAVDEYVRRTVSSIPDSSRVLVTAHDAFGYFGRAYDIEIRAVQGISTESAAGIRDINDLVDFIVERKIKAVFVESSVTGDHLKAVIEGAADRGWEVRVGGQLFSDAMGPADTYEGTYIGMMDHNATLIARALGGEAPEDGMQSKLAAGSEQP